MHVILEFHRVPSLLTHRFSGADSLGGPAGARALSGPAVGGGYTRHRGGPERKDIGPTEEGTKSGLQSGVQLSRDDEEEENCRNCPETASNSKEEKVLAANSRVGDASPGPSATFGPGTASNIWTTDSEAKLNSPGESKDMGLDDDNRKTASEKTTETDRPLLVLPTKEIGLQ